MFKFSISILLYLFFVLFWTKGFVEGGISPKGGILV